MPHSPARQQGLSRASASGCWSNDPPPYLDAICEEDFVRLKEQWLYRTMCIGSLLPSYRVIAYFVVDHLNWSTMDSWSGQERLAGLVGTSTKTIQRSLDAMEKVRLLTVWRRTGSRHPLRTAPNYLPELRDATVPNSGLPGPQGSDTGVHQSFLGILPEPALVGCRGSELPRTGKRRSARMALAFNPAQRGRIECQVAHLLGGFDVLSRLAAIDDQIVTRLCQAHCTGNLHERQIKAAKLAAQQSRAGQ